MEALNKVNELLKPLFDAVDHHFESFEPLSKLAQLLRIRTAHIVLILFFMAVIALGTGLLSNVFVAIFGFIYPAYMTFKALSTNDQQEVKGWLTYWIVFGFFTAFSGILKSTLFFFLSRRAFNVFRIFFYVFLFHPYTKGAALIYSKFLRGKLAEVTAEIKERKSE